MTTRQQRQARRKAQRTRYSRYNFDAAGVMPATPELKPGDELRIETPLEGPSYEANVGVPLGQALMYGGGAALVSVWVPILTPAPWWVPLVVFPTVTGVAVFITPRALRKLLIRVEEWTGVDVDGDGQTGNNGDIRRPPTRARRGSSTRWRFPLIPAPEVGHEWLARWFWRIHRQNGIGFSQNVGQRYHIQRDEVKAIQDAFIAEGWARCRADGRVVLNDAGLDEMAKVVTEIYPDACLSPNAA